MAGNFLGIPSPTYTRSEITSERRLPPLEDLPAMPIKESSRLAVRTVRVLHQKTQSLRHYQRNFALCGTR